MLNGLRRVRPDEPFSVTADGWNTIVDAVNDWAQGRKDQPSPAGRLIGCVEALALNSTGAALREYKPARVTAAGGYNIGNDEPAAVWNRRPLLTLGAPAAITDWVCVTLEAIPAGAIGRVAISGVCLCDVDSASGATWAAPQAGSTAALLGGSTGTVRVLHVPSSGGSQRRCAVYLHEREPSQTQGQLCEITPSVRRELIGVYQVKSGANVTDVYQRFQDVTTDANGCVSRGDPYCVVAPTDCGTSRDPVFYCIDDVCWEFYDGLVPATFDAGPFETAEACNDGCPAEGGVPSCCPSAEYATMFATLSGGHGTKVLAWNGTSWRSAAFALGCDSGSFMLNFSTGCELTWSDDGGETFYGITPAGTTSCGPPLSSTGWSFAPGGTCGTITVTVESP